MSESAWRILDFIFELAGKAERVLQEDVRVFKEKSLMFDRCSLEAGCFREVVQPKKLGSGCLTTFLLGQRLLQTGGVRLWGLFRGA